MEKLEVTFFTIGLSLTVKKPVRAVVKCPWLLLGSGFFRCEGSEFALAPEGAGSGLTVGGSGMEPLVIFMTYVPFLHWPVLKNIISYLNISINIAIQEIFKNFN